MTETRPRVLVVDDEPDLAALLAFNLNEAGFQVRTCTNGEECLAALEVDTPEVLLLDLMLPGVSGLQLCRLLRTQPSQADTGILILTARGEEFDRVVGFEAGADDYVTKPYSVRELILRVRTLAERAVDRRLARHAPRASVRYEWGAVVVESSSHSVTLDGVPVLLRPLEYKLLTTLLSQPGRAFSRSELLVDVWSWNDSDDSVTRTVDTTVRRLRQALGKCGDLIETVHSVGYRARKAPAA